MERIENMIMLFIKTTVGVLFAAAVYITVLLGWDLKFGVELLWQILLVSLVCTIGSLFFPIDDVKQVSRLSMLIHTILYYIYVNAAILFCGFQFGWFSFNNLEQVIGMLLLIALVYGIMAAYSYWTAYRLAEKMNEKLKERE